MIESGHIFIASTSYCEYDRRIQRIADCLAGAGYRITWASRRYKSLSPNLGVKHIAVKCLSRSGPLFYLEYNIRLFILLLFARTDIYYAVDLDTLAAARLAGLLRFRPVVFDAHEIFYEVPELSNKKLKKSIWKALAKMFIPGLRYALTVNQSLKDHYETRYHVPFEVIRNIPPLVDHPPEATEPEKILLYIGALNKGRGIDVAIEAMASLSGYRLYLLGEGDLSDELRALAESKEYEDRIFFEGYVKPDHIEGYMKRAFAGLNILSDDNENYRYSLANKFFDYMHAAVPGIHMNFPEYQKIITEFPVGVLLEEDTPDALVQAVRKLEDEDFYNQLQQHCVRARQVYNWQTECSRLKKLFDRINRRSS